MTLTSATEGAAIYVTIDGSTPSKNNGFLYSGLSLAERTITTATTITVFLTSPGTFLVGVLQRCVRVPLRLFFDDRSICRNFLYASDRYSSNIL
ncbi:MAG: chitobiase/beta-hexosaminidase C-terminal domain-containing protein [Treponema sp.]|nr:chitobiase/beta-hexosaminidase C-terminal domain-containing protein [Treponema sp.]